MSQQLLSQGNVTGKGITGSTMASELGGGAPTGDGCVDRWSFEGEWFLSHLCPPSGFPGGMPGFRWAWNGKALPSQIIWMFCAPFAHTLKCAFMQSSWRQSGETTGGTRKAHTSSGLEGVVLGIFWHQREEGAKPGPSYLRESGGDGRHSIQSRKFLEGC